MAIFKRKSVEVVPEISQYEFQPVTIRQVVVFSSWQAGPTFVHLEKQGENFVKGSIDGESWFTKKVETDNNKWLNDFMEITEILKKNERPIFAVSSDADNLMIMLKTAGIDIPVYKGDLVAIKTAARSIPTLFEMQQGVILDKWGRGDFKDAKTDILR